MEFDSEKRARSNNGCIQSMQLISKFFPSPIVFCDASVRVDASEKPVYAQIALWDLQSCEFLIEQVPDLPLLLGLTKRMAVDKSEAAAIKKAHDLFPDDKILSDSKNAIRACSRDLDIHAEWIPRELNGIANLLAKYHDPGHGYIAFNNPSPTRGWISLVRA